MPAIFTEPDESVNAPKAQDAAEKCDERHEEPDWRTAHREQLADLALVIDDLNRMNGWTK